MKYLLLLLTFHSSLITFHLSAQVDYPKIFGQKFKDATHFYQTHKREIEGACVSNAVPVQTAMSVVFPELLRYNPSKDVVETMGNRVFYVNFGGNYGDFSIGCFQMKPSFIEKMERYVAAHSDDLINFTSIAKYTETDTSAIRKARIQRLSSLKWQLKYVFCFIEVMNNRFPQIEKMTQEEKIKFYATAYNRGFDVSEAEIKKWQNIPHFPDGYGKPKQHCYGDIAWGVYTHFGEWLK